MNVIEEEIAHCEKKLKRLRSLSHKRDLKQEELRSVSEKYGVGEEEILGMCVNKEIMPARRELVRNLRNKYEYTFESIGKFVGGRNHSGIMYLYKYDRGTRK